MSKALDLLKVTEEEEPVAAPSALSPDFIQNSMQQVAKDLHLKIDSELNKSINAAMLSNSDLKDLQGKDVIDAHNGIRAMFIKMLTDSPIK